MKKGRVARIFVLTMMATITLFSCRKEYSLEGEVVITGDFRANIDGVEWIASDGAKNVTILGGIINITGVDPNNKGLSITIVDTAVGLYTLSQTSASLGAYGDLDSTGAYTFTTNQGANASQAGGIVNITDVDYIHNTISGTFSFNVFRNIDGHQKVITNGVFYKLPFTNTQPPPNTTDTLQAIIDGSNWKANTISAQTLTNQLIIAGSLTNGNQSVGLIMPSAVAAGSYTLDFTGRTYIGLYNPTPNIALASSSGTLTILSNDVLNRRIRGNFNFQVIDPLGGPTPTHDLTSGFFSVGY
ncbi:MAG TPA: DUF6252 family protein [Puia sp.]|nr:DUF6252 family protein [Puia sp.]